MCQRNRDGWVRRQRFGERFAPSTGYNPIKVRTRLTLCAAVALLSTQMQAQDNAKLQFPTEGSFQIWTAQDFPKSSPKAFFKANGASFQLPLDKTDPKDKVFVWDIGTGNLAMKPVAEVKKGWSLSKGDFKYIHKVIVRVEGKDGPASVATVNLDDGKRKLQALIDPESQGEAEVYGVLLGSVKVSAEARSKGETVSIPERTYDLLPARQDAAPVLKLISDQPLDTAKSAPTGKAEGEGAATTKAPEGSAIGRILGFLVVLGAMGGLIWYGLRFLKANPDAVKKKLEDLGVSVPNPTPVDDTPPPAVPVVPQPPAKIVLDDLPMAGMGAATASEPTLVASDGSRFELPEGKTDVGRDATGLGLPNETTISRRHAEFERSGATVVLRDLGSTNGTYVNGVKIEGETVLNPGDAVQFGAVGYRFEG